MAEGIATYDPNIQLGSVKATQAAAGVSTAGSDSQAGQNTRYFAQQFQGLTGALAGQLKKSEENAYLDGVADEQKGIPVQKEAPWFAGFEYRQGVSNAALQGSIADFQTASMTKLQEAIAAGQTPEQFMDGLKPVYSDLLDKTKGNLTLDDRLKAVKGIQSSIQAIGTTYRDQYAKHIHAGQIQNGNMAVGARVRNAIQVQQDPQAFSANFSAMLDEATSAAGLDATERSALITNGVKAMMDGVTLNFGQRPAIGQFLSRAIANHAGVQSLGPQATSDILNATQGFVKEGAARDMALLHVKLAQATTAIDGGKAFDPNTFKSDEQELDKAMATGVITPSDYQSARLGIEQVKRHSIEQATQAARLAGANDGILTAKDAKAVMVDTINGLVASQFNGDRSHAQEAQNIAAVSMLKAGGMNVQPEVAALAQETIAKRLNLVATTDTSVYKLGKTGAPEFPAADVALISGMRDEYQRSQHGQPNNYVGMTAGMDSKQIAALQHAMATTLGSDAQHTLAAFQQSLKDEREGKIQLTTTIDPSTMRDMAYTPTEGADLLRTFFQKHGPVSWGRTAWAGVSHAGTHVMEWLTGQKTEGTQAENAYQTQFTNYINGMQTQQALAIQIRDGGLPIGTDGKGLRAYVQKGIQRGMIQGVFQAWPMDAATLNVSPQLSKMSADTRGEFIDKVVKDQCQIKGINPDNVLGVRLRANGRTIQPEIWTKTSTEPIRVNPFNDADVARFRREHIAFSTAARDTAAVRDVSTGQVLNLNLSGRNSVGVDAGEYIQMQKSLLKYEGFSSKPYKDPVRGFNIGAGLSDTTGQGSLFGAYARLPAYMQTPQTIADMSASSTQGIPMYLNNYVKPAVAAMHVPWGDRSPLARDTREMFLNVAWQRPADAVGMANALNQLRITPGKSRADVAAVLSQFPSYRQAHKERQQFYLNTAAQFLPR